MFDRSNCKTASRKNGANLQPIFGKFPGRLRAWNSNVMSKCDRSSIGSGFFGVFSSGRPRSRIAAKKQTAISASGPPGSSSAPFRFPRRQAKLRGRGKEARAASDTIARLRLHFSRRGRRWRRRLA